MTEENHEKTPVRLVGTGIWTRDLPNASLVRYHGATSLGAKIFLWPDSTKTPLDATSVTDFFNVYYRRIQKPVMFIIDNYPTV